MKQLLTTFAILLLTTFLFVACNDKAATTTTEDAKTSFDLGAAKKSIDSINVVFGNLVSKGDSVGLAALYTSDAKMMGANMPAASGRSGIQASFAGMFAAMGTPGLTLRADEVYGTEDLVSEVGVYTMTDKSGKEIDKGKYIVLWKMEDGQWKLFRDIFNSDNPPPPSPSK